ncbi:transposase [Acetobacter sp.]|uniref:transposase n=1 Tax=Acetobacter sp. TaxID=440 RepID=UPI0039E7358C
MSRDAAIETIIGEDPVLTRRREILLSIPGLGHVTAQALLADMPELGAMDETQATSLAVLAPVVTRQSGK